MFQQPLKLDMTKLEDSTKVLPYAPLLNSYSVGWNELFLAYYHHPGYETPTEHLMAQHVLDISDRSNWVQHERRVGDRYQSYWFGNGEIAFCPANTLHWAVWQQEVHFTLITFAPQLLTRLANECTDRDRLELIPRFQFVDPVIQQLASALKADLQAGCPAGQIYGESLGVALAVHLLTTCATLPPKISIYSDGLPQYKLQQVTDYIHAHLNLEIKLSDLARTVGMSQYYFCRLFKQSTGMTPHQYLIRLRVERAKQLLKQPHLAIADVALQCGFSHQSHLSCHFRHLVGMSPKTFQQQ